VFLQNSPVNLLYSMAVLVTQIDIFECPFRRIRSRKFYEECCRDTVNSNVLCAGKM